MGEIGDLRLGGAAKHHLFRGVLRGVRRRGGGKPWARWHPGSVQWGRGGAWQGACGPGVRPGPAGDVRP